MKISKMVFAVIFAIGIGSPCAYAQTASSSIATFTAVVTHVDTTAGTISLTQTLPAKPRAAHDSPTLTADYQAATVLLSTATVGATVQATVQRINGNPAVIALQTRPATASSTPTLTSSPVTDAVSNPARMTPTGAQ